eukprot:s3467_g3.t1
MADVVPSFDYSFCCDHSAVENQNEGPVLYISTWYGDCSTESVSEDSRVARLDVMTNLWADEANDIQQLWQDRIIRDEPALNMDGAAHAIMTVDRSANSYRIVSFANLERVCRGRKCTVHRGAHDFILTDPLQSGEAVKLFIPPPGGRAGDDLVLRPQAVEILRYADPLLADAGPSLRLEAQPPIVQQLFQVWQQQAQGSSALQERFLEVTTWYLDGVYVTFNDESRPALLGGDFHNWIQDLRKIWHDMEDASLEIELVIVQPTPACSPLARTHVLLYQQIWADHRGCIVTLYDNAVQRSTPYSAAVILPEPVTRPAIMRAIGQDAALTQPGVQCSTWYEGIEISGERALALQHGYSLNVQIYRHVLPQWDAPEDDGIELLQRRMLTLGGQPDQRIGDWQSEGMHERSQPFIDFLAMQDMFLPSTFQECHHGSGGTWLHQDGTWKRNDCIGLSETLPLTQCVKWIPEDVDFSVAKEYYRPLFAEVSWKQHFPAPVTSHTPQRRPRPDEFDARALQAVSQQAGPSFHVDVHTHAIEIQEQILACGASSNQPPTVSRPRKQSISDQTWELIQTKKLWRSTLADQHQLQ